MDTNPSWGPGFFPIDQTDFFRLVYVRTDLTIEKSF